MKHLTKFSLDMTIAAYRGFLFTDKYWLQFIFVYPFTSFKLNRFCVNLQESNYELSKQKYLFSLTLSVSNSYSCKIELNK